MDHSHPSPAPAPSEARTRSERADAAANRDRVLAAAAQLFAARGVAAVSTAEIARQAGVGKGTLFRRFPTKADLCMALVQDALEVFYREVTATLQAMGIAGAVPATQLAWLLGAILAFNEAHLDLLSEAHSPSRHRPGVLPPIEGQSALVRQVLAAAAATGALAPAFDVVVLADLLMAPLRPPMLRFHRMTRQYTPAQLQAELERLVSRLLQPL